MSNHYASTKDEAPPAPSPTAQKRAADRARYVALCDKGTPQHVIRELMGITPEALRTLAKATGRRAPVDRGAGECAEAMAPRGVEFGARGGRR